MTIVLVSKKYKGTNMKKMISAILICSSIVVASSFQQGISQLKSGDEKGAYDSFFISAKSGDIDSQTILGEMYLDGIGIEPNHQKAFFWLSKAANSGDIEAQYLLGFMYENGLNVAVDINRAVKWYTKAAEGGDILSQYNLAVIYKEGRDGVQKDLKTAFKWLNMVADAKEKMEFVVVN